VKNVLGGRSYMDGGSLAAVGYRNPVSRLPLRHLLVFTLATGSIGLVACASDSDNGVEVTYSATARQNYEKALGELKDENFPEARKLFAFVRSKFPFSKYAVLAELALADTRFAMGDYQSAIDAYKAFMRLHPTHEKVEDGYASFRICRAYIEEMPEDWLILPPAAEKDQAAVQDAARELSDFIDKFPESTYLKDAHAAYKVVLRRLVEHEVYVARFYLSQGFPRAAILRLEGAIRRYPDSGKEAELLLTLGQTHLEMGNPLSARRTFEKVMVEYVGAPQADRARVYVEFIENRFGKKPVDSQSEGPALKPEPPKTGKQAG